MKIYLAGKIGKNDWRHSIVRGLRGAVHGAGQWPVLEGAIEGGHDYVGPFFISDDHGSAHGDNAHGVDAGGEWPWIGERPEGLKPHDTFDRRSETAQRCIGALRSADLVFAWLDDPTAYGTLVELGYASALDLVTVVGTPLDCHDDLWFARMVADYVVHATTPGDALKRAIEVAGPSVEKLVTEQFVSGIVARCESPIERKMLLALVERGVVVGDRIIVAEHTLLLQHETCGFRLDFGLVSQDGKHRVAIECDGHQFHDRTPEQAARDKSRDRTLTEGGWRVLRFTGTEITRDAKGCAEQIVRIASTT